ncbi:mCG147954 [Mus musculus]|nr:mCG147954 [Mus musculus]
MVSSSDCFVPGMLCFLIGACGVFRRSAFRGQEHSEARVWFIFLQRKNKCVHN